jgi:hypothetical protein
MRLSSRLVEGPRFEVPGGTAVLNSQVEALVFGRCFATRHRPVAVTVTTGAGTVRHAIPDPGRVLRLASYALLVLSIVRRRR